FVAFCVFFLKKSFTPSRKKTKKKRFTNEIPACSSSPEERRCDDRNPTSTRFNSPIKHWKKEK
ncbi:hypothetical protein Anapl_05540, partial [Anas platyrhynchos]